MAAKTFNEVSMSTIEKYNPYHDGLGRFTTGASATSFSIGGKSKGARTAIENEKKRTSAPSYGKYGSGDLSDAIAEIKGGKDNSLAPFIDKNGNLAPERKRIHDEIIDSILKGKTPPEGQPTLRIMGGGPASGKSTAIKQGLVEKMPGEHSIVIDPDGLKAMLPGYAGMAKKNDQTASYFHEESSMLAKQLHEAASEKGINITYDGTGDGSPKSLQKKIDSGKKHGFKVEGVYVTIDTDEAVRRNKERYDNAVAKGESPRLVPEETVRKTHANVTRISVEKAKEFDSIVLVDNNGERGHAKIIATGGNGKNLTPVKGCEKEFQKYLDKAGGIT